jgi:SAM-dependent methyltransferase
MRALIYVLERLRPDWRQAAVLESSPGSPSSRYIATHCAAYTQSQYFADLASGEYRDGVRREDLEKLTYPDESLDIVITQDVFEHVLDPAAAFDEIRRVLRDDGCHIWTVPIYSRPRTLVRARRGQSGEVEYLEPPEYHGNPLGGGSLVVREWGNDIIEFADTSKETRTTRHQIHSWRQGIRGPMTDVLVTRRRR